MFKKLIDKFRCNHEYKFIRNIYGDEINWCGGYRSVWKCKKCGKIEYRHYLQQDNICDKLDNLYDEYYKNKYNEWCLLRADTLNHMLNEMTQLAQEGCCSADFMLNCEEKYNDKNYYEKWFNENKLKYEFNLVGKEELEFNQYKCHVRWKYKY